MYYYSFTTLMARMVESLAVRKIVHNSINDHNARHKLSCLTSLLLQVTKLLIVRCFNYYGWVLCRFQLEFAFELSLA